MRQKMMVIVPMVLLLAAVCAGAESDYTVKLERPYRVGDKTKVAAVGAIKEAVTRKTDGEAASRVDETVGIRLDGVLEVKAVDDQGRRTEVRFVVSACTVMRGTKSQRLLAPGKVITIRWQKDETHYFVDDQDWTEEAGELLDLVAELNDPASVSDDKIFRTDAEKRKVNDTWAIDAAAAAREFGRVGLKTKDEDIWGETTLKSTEQTEGVPTLSLGVRFKANNLSGPGRRPERKMTIVKATIDSDGVVVVPTDPKAQAVREEGKVQTSSEVDMPTDAGKMVHLSRKTERLYERVMSPAK